MTDTPRFAQVGGHAATIILANDSSIVNKPSTASEHAFYTQLGPSLHDDLIGTWTPAFYGTLTLQGQVQEDGQSITPLPDASSAVKEMLVLENLTHRFVRPNVLDIKLGTQLFDEHASEEKKARMTKAAADTTSAQTGVRLTGFQVWDSSTQAFHTTDKTFGKTIKVDELPSGFARFFYPPLCTHEPSPPATDHPKPLPKTTLLPVLDAVHQQLQELEELLHDFEVRIRGSSLLIVIEGDPEALEASLERIRAAGTTLADLRGAQPQNLEQDDEDADDQESVSTSDSAGNPKAHTLLPFSVKWIDFAHARSATGEGKDQGLIRGVQTSRQLLADLRARIEAEP